MEYEVFEPDPNDEYYDQMCSAAYATMFNGRSDSNAVTTQHSVPVDCDFLYG